MEIVDRALESVITDDQVLAGNPEAWELAVRVNAMRQAFDLPDALQPTSSGKELKAALKGLPPHYQTDILGTWARPKEVDNKPIVCQVPEYRPEIEDHKLRHWIIKALITLFCFLACVLGTAVAVVGVKSGQLPDNPAIEGIINSASEILKLIISS
jgi:hypothetical protein